MRREMVVLTHNSFRFCFLLSFLGVGSLLPVLVQQVCRHGDRAPIHLFPNNVNKDYWVQGLGYLTPKGESMLYANGKSFRDLWYPGMLSDVVYPTEIKVISSHVDRCIMSANAFLAALYPPTGPYVFEEGLNWQAFPTHTISSEIDYYLSGTDCPAWDEELARLYSTSNYTAFVNENQDFVNQVCGDAGYPRSEWNLQSFGLLYDNLVCDKAHNLTIPSWVTDDVYIRMRNVMNVKREFEFTDQRANYLDTGGGPLLGLMLENIMSKMANNLTQKFIYYSAHDATVLPFMGNLDQPVGPNPPYASCAFLELYQTAGNQYQVQLLYKNTTEGQMQQPRMIPGCNALKCDLKTFVDLVQNKVNMDPKTACYDVRKKTTNCDET